MAKAGQAILAGRLSRMGGVSGFYSDWSPAISTDQIKILTADSEHPVEVPEECQITPPRLGEVHEARFSLARSLKLGADATEDAEPTGTPFHEHVPHRQVKDASAEFDRQLPRALKSLQWASWAIVVLLVISLMR